VKNKKKISIIGLGYVGLATFLILSNLKKNNKFLYKVIGIEKNNNHGDQIKKNFYNKKNWILSLDKKFKKLFNSSANRKDISITTNINDTKDSDVILVSVGFEVIKKDSRVSFLELCNQISKNIKKGALIIFESTLPPGTCNNLILPLFKKNLGNRGISLDNIYFAYSYERVTPGNNYINSIISSPRCYSGMNSASKKKCSDFLKTFINSRKYKLTEFDNLTECETSKILENSYRAINIAFIDEWTKFAPKLKIDLLKIINAIKLRPTHANLMKPGIGVGGYCLTKDPDFINYSAKKIYKSKHKFPIINTSMKINRNMPQTSFDYLKSKTKIKNKNILLCGFTYKEDTNDFRNSPTLELISFLLKNGAKISVFDPWIKKGFSNLKKVNFLNKVNFKKNIIIFTVAHKLFKKIKVEKINKNTKIFDLNNCLSNYQLDRLRKKKIQTNILGRN
jgi:UDP-N-acetyl-D-glucosamine dehydrogenase